MLKAKNALRQVWEDNERNGFYTQSLMVLLGDYIGMPWL